MKPVKFKPYLQVSKTSQGGKSPIFISLTQYSQTALIAVGHSVPVAYDPLLLFRKHFFKLQIDLRTDSDIAYFEKDE